MLEFWIDACLSLSERKADFYSGCRKIHRNVSLTFDFDAKKFKSLKISDAGYTKSKLSLLRKLYYLEPSVEMAKKLWLKRVASKKYGSVSFSCYGHDVKGNVEGKTPRGSVMGPCLQSVVLTFTEKRKTSVNVYYRSTELFKKYPADLVFIRDQLLVDFDFTNAPIQDITFVFANVTIHPMYAVTFLPHLEDPIKWLEKVKKKDKYFYDWLVKWSARYLCEEYSRGILKFSQALRVRKAALEMFDKDTIKKLQKYFRANHPGYRGDDKEDEEEE